MNQFIKDIYIILAHDQIIEDEFLRYAYRTDASLYQMLPKLILLVKREEEVIQVIQSANRHNIKLTFRAAGTSLSGQAVTQEVLVVLSNDSWNRHLIHKEGKQITLEPGVIGANANNLLNKYQRRIGPDPGSINSAKIGGIIANNSSGMCCGISKNSYATLVNMRAIFANSSVLDSSSKTNIEKFKEDNSHLISGILRIKEQISSDIEVSSFIRKKFAIKNTSGYSLNAFLDFEDPIKIIERLLIGSEGTLGFISSVTLNTVVDEPYKALNLIYGSLQELVELTVKISHLDISAIELLDYLSLESVSHVNELKPYLIKTHKTTAAIMIELTASNEEQLNQKLIQINNHINDANILHQTGFLTDQKLTAILWKARKGILPSLAGQRPPGTTVLIEDVAVAMNLLPALIDDMHGMFKKYQYTNAAIFGHVKDGNIHFVLTPNFADQEEIQRYDQFMRDFTELVSKKYHGSLKAEHGSGRNIASFAHIEWGKKCWDIMWQIKHLFDPKNIFNPDVKLTLDKTLHLRSLKTLPITNHLIDKCMECGFCEEVCPSRNFSLTPRQRIALAREIDKLPEAKQKLWQKKYEYYGIDTCATTGMCQTRCPVGINTGEFILSLKSNKNNVIKHDTYLSKAKTKIQMANSLGRLIGRSNLQLITEYAHSKQKVIPVYLKNMPQAQKFNFEVIEDKPSPQILLMPACPNRIFAASALPYSYPNYEVLEKMGFSVNYIKPSQGACCGQLYHSQNNLTMQENSIKEFTKYLSPDAITLIDNSSCAEFAAKYNLRTQDINRFIVENINPLNLKPKYHKIALHIDCSSSKNAFNEQYITILKKCADEIIIPDGIYCCGFAGDKGFTTPELNKSSLANLKEQVSDCEVGVTFNRSCQIGLSYHSQINYISLAELVLQCWTTI